MVRQVTEAATEIWGGLEGKEKGSLLLEEEMLGGGDRKRRRKVGEARKEGSTHGQSRRTKLAENSGWRSHQVGRKARRKHLRLERQGFDEQWSSVMEGLRSGEGSDK